jgi:hypothetical protein
MRLKTQCVLLQRTAYPNTTLIICDPIVNNRSTTVESIKTDVPGWCLDQSGEHVQQLCTSPQLHQANPDRRAFIVQLFLNSFKALSGSL